MTQLIIVIAVFVLLIALFVTATVIGRKKGRKHSVPAAVLLAAEVPVVITLAFLIYAMMYYHADESVNAYLVDDENVNVEQASDWYFFDGPGEDSAVIFYPGAKVEFTAYAPLMHKLAEDGTDCFLVRMPLNVALLGVGRADKIKSEYSYDKWYLAGHSLGGAMAAKYCEEPGRADGLILLAAYSISPLPADLDVCVICASKDGCINYENFEKYRKNLPGDTRFVTIEGGNHANFGYYGDQEGDNPADISREEQQRITADYIINFCCDTMSGGISVNS